MKPHVKEQVRRSPAWLDPARLDITEPLDWSRLFGAERAGEGIELDLGAGDGDFIAARAARFPERGFLGVERLLGRALKIARKANVRGLENLKALRLESWYTLRYLVPPASVAAVHLMFPDPWPKQRHAGNRLVQPEFAVALARALRAGGEFRFTTDHEAYFREACEVIDADSALEHQEAWDFGADARTDFQAQWEAQGRVIHRARWGLPTRGTAPKAPPAE
ncbi:MAG: tRNA (guanosine(46)-N7)-methyltransferase TrmB [Verrucomicrobiota bacterium]